MAEPQVPERHLPGHIAAALARAGGPADSAGRPWAGRDLSGDGNPLHNFDDDDGLADAGYAAAVRRLIAGDGTEAEVIQALAGARVFVPIVAELGEEADGGHGLAADKQADMALVTLKAPDGRKALPVFSSVQALQAWHPQARPVAVYAARAALSAVAEQAELMVLDPGAEMTFVARRPAVWALAQQKAWLPAYADAALAGIVSSAASGEPRILRIQLEAGSGVATRTAAGQVVPGGGPGPELRLVIRLEPGLEQDEVRDIVGSLQQSLSTNQDFVERVDSLEVRPTR
jgi:SseB protein N-terminal domain